jgi:predicted small lipoprotein YifL
MIGAAQRSVFVSRYRDRQLLCLVLIGALAAALALSGCGRKGSLDPPPAASVTGEQPAASHGGQAQSGNAGTAARAPNRHFPLDPLLN